MTTWHKPGDKSRMKKEPYCNYNKRDIFEVICDTDIPERQFDMLSLFLFGIALSTLRATSSEYPVGISNLFRASNLTLTTLGVFSEANPRIYLVLENHKTWHHSMNMKHFNYKLRK
jgi:hypothetical protein